MGVLDRYSLIVGLDAEYVSASELPNPSADMLARQCPTCTRKGPDIHCEKRTCHPVKNIVLSHQLSYRTPNNPATRDHIVYTEGRTRRPYFSHMIGGVIEDARAAGMISEADICNDAINIIVAAHFSRAELATFADFNKLKKRAQNVRGTYATINHRDGIRVPYRMPGVGLVNIRVRLLDTMLLAPGRAPLAALGDWMGVEKLSMPPVIDEQGQRVPAIRRMDLCLQQHPAPFEAYALRDAVIARDWIFEVATLADAWGLETMPATVASKGIEKIRSCISDCDLDPLRFCGWQKPPREQKTMLPAVGDIKTLTADCFHGGLNIACEIGVHDGDITDLDLKGAYTSAMAALRPADWDAIQYTKDVDTLARHDALTFARAEFEFPPDTRFPCLPVANGGYGLCYPLSGETCCCGPELELAVQMGARITVKHGVYVPWAGTARPLVDFAKFINHWRARFPKGTHPGLHALVKEVGNSGYGKFAQAVAGWKTNPVTARVFDTRNGTYQDMPESGITCAPYAAYITSIVRATLAEAVAGLPAHVTMMSATTDGFLSDATLAEAKAATSGAIGTWFAELRGMVDPNGDTETLEVKHRAQRVLVVKTRGGMALFVEDETNVFIARAGHKIPHWDRTKPKIEEAHAWEEIIRNREYGDVMTRKSLVSLPKQYRLGCDLIDETRDVASNLDFDFKRMPVDVRDYDGIIRFGTAPFATVEDCLHWRRAWDEYRHKAEAVLKSADDWLRFHGWMMDGQPGGVDLKRTQFERAVLAAFAHRIPGFDIKYPDAVKLLEGCGVAGITTRTLDNIRRRTEQPQPRAIAMTSTDLALGGNLAAALPLNALKSVLL